MTFLILMIAGLIGLILMALPGLQQHGHAGVSTPHITPHAGLHIGAAGHGHSTAHGVAHAPHVPTQAGSAAAGAQQGSPAGQTFEFARLIPSPRAIFSTMMLFGAFGYALLPLVHLWQLASLLAIIPACAIEYFAIRPLWNLMFQFQGRPCSPMEALVLTEARAVTPFRNGKGIVAVEHDGRAVQFSARLQAEHANVPVKVGDTLCVEEVDPANQRVMVSVK